MPNSLHRGTMMKKVLGLVLALSLVLATAAFGATTVTDTVGVSYSAAGTVVLLGIVGDGKVALATSSSWGQTVAGARAVNGGASVTAADGGFLHYTTYGVADQKITVQKDASTAAGYANDSLAVKIKGLTVGGSVIGTLGTGASTYQSIGATAKTLIDTISGTDTWTGTGVAEGAQLSYQLTGDAGASTVVVLYTILAK